MINGIEFNTVKAPLAANENVQRAYCAEVFTPGVGWTVHMSTGSGRIECLPLEDFIWRIYQIENQRLNRRFLDRASDMRASLTRIRHWGVAP